MFDASPEEYVPWLAEVFAAPAQPAVASDGPLSDAERARLRFQRWRLARPRDARAAAGEITRHPDFW